MKRILFTDEEYEELAQFAQDRKMNPKEAILAFVRAGNRVSSSKVVRPAEPEPSKRTEQLERD